MNPQTDVQLASRCENMPSPDQIRNWTGAALRVLQCDQACLTVRMVDEPEMTQLNERFRGRPGPTNVLSFPFETPPGLPEPTSQLGDIVVCAPLAEREAATQTKTVEAHFAHLVVHGVLHLRGHDHQEEREAQEMETLEKTILAGLGFSDPYQGA